MKHLRGEGMRCRSSRIFHVCTVSRRTTLHECLFQKVKTLKPRGWPCGQPYGLWLSSTQIFFREGRSERDRDIWPWGFIYSGSDILHPLWVPLRAGRDRLSTKKSLPMSMRSVSAVWTRKESLATQQDCSMLSLTRLFTRLILECPHWKA